MAELAIDLPVFVASPNDVAAERRIADEEIRRLAGDAAEHALLLTPILWEQSARPGKGAPQDLINDLLARAELVVVIFSASLGSSGTLRELLRATRQVFRGASDDVFVYFHDDGAMSDSVRDFREQLDHGKQYFFWNYKDEESFRTLFRAHLQKWIRRWERVPPICRLTLKQAAPGNGHRDQSGENRLLFIRETFRYDNNPQIVSQLGKEAVRLYQEHGPSGAEVPIAIPTRGLAALIAPTEPSRLQAVRFSQMFGQVTLYPSPLRNDDGEIYFSDREWFSFFCACRLIEAIVADDITAVKRKPYVNSVHQYLSVLARRDAARIIPALERWLLNQDGVTDLQPIARNFAAYVLGMIDAHDAEAALAHAALNDGGRDVRLYSVTALGKLRSRRHLGLLIDLYDREDDGDVRTVLGQAVCRTIGIAQYEL